MERPESVENHLPWAESVLAVCAHPDDESFGLGAALSTFAEQGVTTSVLCLTHGEASTLGADAGDLHEVRETELALELGVGSVRLLEFADGRLTDESTGQLSSELRRAVDLVDATLLLVFDEGGITGHPDHMRATGVATIVAEEVGIPVLAWVVPEAVAAQLNDEFAATFLGRPPEEIDVVVEVDRSRQHRAISCHASQSSENPLLWRRLELQDNREVFRWLSGSAAGASGASPEAQCGSVSHRRLR